MVSVHPPGLCSWQRCMWGPGRPGTVLCVEAGRRPRLITSHYTTAAVTAHTWPRPQPRHGGQRQRERGEPDQRVPPRHPPARTHRQGAEGPPRLRGHLRVRQPRAGGLRVGHRVWRLHPPRHLQPQAPVSGRQYRMEAGVHWTLLHSYGGKSVPSWFPFLL